MRGPRYFAILHLLPTLHVLHLRRLVQLYGLIPLVLYDSHQPLVQQHKC